jgi:hypothetical protein
VEFDPSVLNSSVTHPHFHSKRIETSVQSCIAPFPRSQIPNGRDLSESSQRPSRPDQFPPVFSREVLRIDVRRP